MNHILALVALAMMATCYALPVDLGLGFDVVKGADVNAWSASLGTADKPLQVGLNWNKDGTVSAGARLVKSINDKMVPLSAAISTNLQDTSKVEYQFGTKLNDQVAGVVHGDNAGKFEYSLSGWAPIQSAEGKTTQAFGAAVVGSGMKPSSLSTGVAIGENVVKTTFSLDDSYAPKSVNVQVGSNSLKF